MKSVVLFEILLFVCFKIYSVKANSFQLDSFPVDKEFITMDETGLGLVKVSGIAKGNFTKIDLIVHSGTEIFYASNSLINNEAPFGFEVYLQPWLEEYTFSLRASDTFGHSEIVATSTGIVCGDSYLIYGQSNAFGYPHDTIGASDFLRTVSLSGNELIWQKASENTGNLGVFGLLMGRTLLEKTGMPVQIVNLSVGGASIDFLSNRNAADPTDVSTQYGKIIKIATFANFKNKIRSIIWRQGETEGSSGYSVAANAYQAKLENLMAQFEQDFPALQRIYSTQNQVLSIEVFDNFSGAIVREAQRRVAFENDKVDLISTHDLRANFDGLHFDYFGQYEIAIRIAKLINSQIYLNAEGDAKTPMISEAFFANAEKDSLTLVFDDEQILQLEPIRLNRRIQDAFILGDGVRITDVTAVGNRINLKQARSTTAQRISFLPSYINSLIAYNGYQGPLVLNQFGISIASFFQYPIEEFSVPRLTNLKHKLKGITFTIQWDQAEDAESIEIKKYINNELVNTFLLPGNSDLFSDFPIQIKRNNILHYEIRVRAFGKFSIPSEIYYETCPDSLEVLENSCIDCDYHVFESMILKEQILEGGNYTSSKSVSFISGFETSGGVFLAEIFTCPD